MVQWLFTFATKPDNLSLISEIHRVKGKNQLLQVICELYTFNVYIYTHTHTHRDIYIHIKKERTRLDMINKAQNILHKICSILQGNVSLPWSLILTTKCLSLAHHCQFHFTEEDKTRRLWPSCHRLSSNFPREVLL